MVFIHFGGLVTGTSRNNTSNVAKAVVVVVAVVVIHIIRIGIAMVAHQYSSYLPRFHGMIEQSVTLPILVDGTSCRNNQMVFGGRYGIHFPSRVVL